MAGWSAGSAHLRLEMMQRLGRAVVAVAVAYLLAVVVWQLLRLVAGDRWWWLASANVLSLYLFLPLLTLLPLAWATRQRVAVVATTVSAAIFLLLYGGFFLPSLAPAGAGDATTFKVMTLNVLYTNDDGAAIERLVQAEQPDLICLQELNRRLAADLVVRLGDEYPYHAFLLEEDPTGLGLFSRYPLRDDGEIPDPAWKHGAQVATVAFRDRPVMCGTRATGSRWRPTWATGMASQIICPSLLLCSCG
ncbi:MAG: hypothetical protein PVG56_12360 [Anaerolineae bacterium]